MSKKKIPSQPSALPNPFQGLNLSGLPEGPAEGPKPEPEKPRGGRLVLRREKSGRSGKIVLVISGFDASWTGEDLEQLSQLLRKKCGCGGTIRDKEIELQGEPVSRAKGILQEQGFTTVGPG